MVGGIEERVEGEVLFCFSFSKKTDGQSTRPPSGYIGIAVFNSVHPAHTTAVISMKEQTLPQIEKYTQHPIIPHL